MMHKDFYASGFLYHFPTQQILLQQTQVSDSSTTSLWQLFGGRSHPDEEAPQVFQRIIREELGQGLDLTVILPVYQFIDKELDLPHFVFYAQVEDEIFSSTSGKTLQWFHFKKLHRTPMSKQTKQNITVAQRVIDLASRLQQGTQELSQ